jgi:hypothetical protein
LAAAGLASSCFFGESSNSGTSGNRPATQNKSETAKAGADRAEQPKTPKPDGNAAVDVPASKADCLNIETGDEVIQKTQTFPVDFKPFAGGCFVTTYNPEYDDPPLESKFGIYKDEQFVFDFPDQFNGVSFGCWVEAVAFEDLNDDQLIDIIVVGKCSGKSAPNNENMLYRNTGRDFTTDTAANAKLADLKRSKDIAEFVKNNKQTFFR